jgi:Protein of unknown function (DUF3048) N-terminal domain/Protein of unknown function (DUF3048) C-terminal domain
VSRARSLPFGAALLSTALLGTALLTGCGGPTPAVSLQPNSAGPSSAATTAAQAASTPAPAGPVAPLTGLPTTAAVAARPAVAVSVPLRGGVGLDKADLVYQEYETAGLLRALAVFQSHDATQIGPVGQVRPADPALLPSLRPLYANSGGASGTEGLLEKAKIIQVTSSSAASAYTYGSAGPMTSTAAVLAAAPTGAKPPPAVLPMAAAGDAFTTSHVGKARTLTVTPPGSDPETWTYSATTRRWSRAGTPGVAVANLILQTVQYKVVRLRHPDRYAQSARVLGRGTCQALSGGTITPCSWYKRSSAAVTGYVDAAGVPLRFATGPTWVVLLAPGWKLAVG